MRWTGGGLACLSGRHPLTVAVGSGSGSGFGTAAARGGYPCEQILCSVPQPTLTVALASGPWSLPEPQYILCVCDDTPTQPTSPHLLLAAVWTSAAAVLPQPATRNVCTRCTCASSTAPRNYLPTHHTLPRQSSLPTAVIVDRKSHCTHPPCVARGSAHLSFPSSSLIRCAHIQTLSSRVL